MKVPENALNPVLYRRAYDKVTKTYGTQTSAYRSMAIVTEYKRLGGKYKGRKKPTEGLSRWLDERWIVVIPYVQRGQVVPCGVKERRRRHACRPLVRVSANTPATIKELVKTYGQATVLRLARTKQTYGSEEVRLDWNNQTSHLKKKQTLL